MVLRAYAPEDIGRFNGLVGFFRRYGDQYGFDYLMIAAQGYQESALDQSDRSKSGAVGRTANETQHGARALHRNRWDRRKRGA
jgi:membrane-bound lytic murein transglycosylase MltF